MQYFLNSSNTNIRMQNGSARNHLKTKQFIYKYILLQIIRNKLLVSPRIKLDTRFDLAHAKISKSSDPSLPPNSACKTELNTNRWTERTHNISATCISTIGTEASGIGDPKRFLPVIKKMTSVCLCLNMINWPKYFHHLYKIRKYAYQCRRSG